MSVEDLKLIKIQQGKEKQGATSTTESREAAELGLLKGTDVYTYYKSGGVNGYGGEFQNYDGFCLSSSGTSTSEVAEKKKEGTSLLTKVTGAKSEANSETENCKGFRSQAKDDVQFVNNQVNKQKSQVAKVKSEVDKNIAERTTLQEQNNQTRNEVDSLNNEIATLMAEDGQTYEPQVAAESQTLSAQGNDNSNPNSNTSMNTGMGVATTSSSADNGASMVNPFAASTVGNEQQSYAPTSLTAVAAQASANQEQQGGQQSQVAKKSNVNQSAGQKQAVSGTNSMASFSSSLPKAKGKNAEKINQLLAQVGEKNSTITTNSSRISSLTASNTSKINVFQAQLNGVMNQTTSKVSNNEENSNGVNAAKVVGTTTTTIGGLAAATGSAMVAGSFGSNALGYKLMAYGGAATSAGSATNSVASMAQGDINGAVNSLNAGLNSFGSTMGAYNNLKLQNTAKA